MSSSPALARLDTEALLSLNVCDIICFAALAASLKNSILSFPGSDFRSSVPGMGRSGYLSFKRLKT